jgi:hypothetical protein
MGGAFITSEYRKLSEIVLLALSIFHVCRCGTQRSCEIAGELAATLQMCGCVHS